MKVKKDKGDLLINSRHGEHFVPPPLDNHMVFETCVKLFDSMV